MAVKIQAPFPPVVPHSMTMYPCGVYGVHNVHCRVSSSLTQQALRPWQVCQERFSHVPRGWRDHTFLGNGACQ